MNPVLTPKQQRFVEEYLKDLNGKQAAVRAGYSPDSAETQSSRLLSNAKVALAIRTSISRRSKRTEVTQDMVLNELRRIAFSGMGSLATWNSSGVSFKDSSELSEDTLATVQEVSETTNQHGGSLKIKQYDKVKALELLGRHLGMWNDKLEITDPEAERPLKEMSDAELSAIAIEKGNG